ncbi:MAG TPA: hypothetical protein DEP72_06150 [Clostridiales bacterium]|nr:MAG: hypothetical protein A2Y18_01565 [Clostridiales bacterium GWD2_32_19]HCC07721.1 hypothetical protein [Clostridiales bacterium]
MSINNEFCCDVKLAEHLIDQIGETVTIFTESGGQSGCGFTGVVLKVNPCFVRLTTCIGPSPACALGNGCSKGYNYGGKGYGYGDGFGVGGVGYGGGYGGGIGYGCGGIKGANVCPDPDTRCDRQLIFTIGSVVDIPIDKIVAIVRNAV